MSFPVSLTKSCKTDIAFTCRAVAAAFIATPLFLLPAAADPGHGQGHGGQMQGGHMMGGEMMGGHMKGREMHDEMMSFGKPGDPAKVDRTVEIVMHDNYYEPETIKVKKGETVRFKVRNAGTLVHEFSLGMPADHMKHQEEMMEMQQHGVLMGDRINRDMMNRPMGPDGHMMRHDHANSVLLEPGETGEVVWTFTSGGNIEMACNVPGHYAAGMVGKIEVEGE